MALAVVPAYVLVLGFTAIMARESRLVPFDSFWRLLPGFGRLHYHPGLTPIAAAGCLIPALLLAWRVPPGPQRFPAVRPALAAASLSASILSCTVFASALSASTRSPPATVARRG